MVPTDTFPPLAPAIRVYPVVEFFLPSTTGPPYLPFFSRCNVGPLPPDCLKLVATCAGTVAVNEPEADGVTLTLVPLLPTRRTVRFWPADPDTFPDTVNDEAADTTAGTAAPATTATSAALRMICPLMPVSPRRTATYARQPAFANTLRKLPERNFSTSVGELFAMQDSKRAMGSRPPSVCG